MNKFDDFDFEIDNIFDDYNKKVDSKKFLSAIQEKLKKKEKEKEELDNPTTKYNEETEEIFNEFANNLLKMYPDILTYKEIINRLKANIKENIIFTDELNEEIGGFFNPNDHQVKIRKGMNEIYTKSVIFHELIHALVENNPFEKYDDTYMDDYYDFEEDINDYLYQTSSFMTEAITTIIEEDYGKKILGSNRRRVNGYIPTYAKELKAIFGNELVENYIKHFKNLDFILPYFKNEKEKIGIVKLCNLIDEICEKVKDGDGNLIEFMNSNIELNLTILLNNYLSNNDISDENKINIIESFVKEQISPNFDYIKSIIEDNIKDKSLIKKHNITNYIYNSNIDNSYNLVNQVVHNIIDKKNEIKDDDLKELVRLRLKYKDYNIKNYFGLYNYTYTYDIEKKMYVYDYDNYFSYLNNKDLYSTLFYSRDNISLDEINTIKGSKSINRDKILNQLKYGTKIDEFGGLDILDVMTSSNTYFKVTTDKESFYIIVDKFIESNLKRSMQIDSAIEYYINLMNNEPREKKGYKLAIKELNRLNSLGINNVFINEYGFIYEEGKDNKSTTIIFEDEEDEAKLEHETFELEKINIPFIKNNSKKM